MSPRTVLVIAAHPDDEILGCGGAIAKHTAQGDKVHVLILAEGVTSRDAKRSVKLRTKDLSLLVREARKANALLGVTSVKFHNFPDNRMDSVDLLDIIKVIEHLRNEINPDIVYTHYEKDGNIDHRRVFEATMVAFRPLPDQRVQKIYSFEVPSSTEYVSFSSHFSPNTFIDISKYLDKKLKALSCYASELRVYPHPRSVKAVELNNILWGIKSGLNAVEAFLLVRNRVF